MEDETEIESEYFQDPEVDREWLEGDLSELQHEGRVQQQVTAAQINQMLLIQAKTGYGSVFDLISDHFPSLVTAYGRENLDGGFITEVDGAPDEMNLGYGPLSASELNFDYDGIDQNSFRFYSNKDSEGKWVIHVIHKESGKRDSVSGRNLENVMKQAVAGGLALHHEYGLDKTRNILNDALKSKHAIDWEKLKAAYEDNNPKPDSRPQLNNIRVMPLEYLPEPQRSDAKYKLLLDDLNVRENAFICDYEAWGETVKRIKRWNSDHEQEIAKWTKTLEQWNARRIRHEEEIARKKADYESFQPKAVSYFLKMVLSASTFPNGFGRKCDLEYIPESKILIVDHALPTPDDLVYVKGVKYAKASDKFFRKRVSLSDDGKSRSDFEFKRFYDDLLYQICLRTFHELFEADSAGALEAVVFNGWIESVDKATGNDTRACVMSVHAKKEEFQKINLARVDPKACFKALKGIGSSTLHSLTPIAPVLKINREDKRFVASYEVASELDERSNLAAMDWEDFEHLIRELFEKEFSKPGCEVKVTQASRDGGVDSVVLDSDPIHGGKTVIQAKRYTNTVGVAAVRELYGTVLNEGAMKGILVTTADYGPDAYEFAKGKPLVLLNGANLLHLLEKHGHKAKIDIQEAKRILGEKAPVFHP